MLILDKSNRLIALPVEFESALQDTDRLISRHISGINENVGTSFESICDEGGLHFWPSFGFADTLQVQSDDVNDAFGGTGAQQVKIYGLGESFELVDDTVDLDGTTPVPTTQKFSRVFGIVIPPTFSGSTPTTKDAAGTITVTDGSNLFSQIVNGNNASLSAIFTIPANHYGLITHGDTSVGKGQDAFVRFFARPFGGVFNAAYSPLVYEGAFARPFRLPLLVDEKTDLDVRAKSTVGAAPVSASFDILLIRKS